MVEVLRRICVSGIFFTICALAQAQAYPSKPIKLIVPFPPAGATDQLARILGERMSSLLGQQVIVDNRPGAGANLGAELAARAAHDGYTLLIAPTSIYAIAATLYSRLSYGLLRDFTLVSTLINTPHVLVVHPSLPARTLSDLIKLDKARPRGLNLASQGSGTVSHLEGEMLARMTNMNLVHVPYRGSTPAVQDLIGGQVDIMFDSIASSLPHIRSGRLRPLAITSGRRSPLLPDVPTMTEAGIPGYVTESWLSLAAPQGTPEEILLRLNNTIVRVLNEPETRGRLAELGLEPQSSSPEECRRRYEAEVIKWRPLVKSSGARVD
ncbi:MAG: tripartite tricarboxylate transporter substrate binding protein [Betaproteobacteria bacterium]|nr:tripartite tricarboxylate transporter substrate binding protein [Betaproteobacteria bacterium]